MGRFAMIWLVALGCNGADPSGDPPGPVGDDDDDGGSTPSVPTDDTDTDGSPTDSGTPPDDDQDDDGFTADVDCDDDDPERYPGAPDACDGVVTDCDRTSDDGLVTVDGVTTFDDLGAALATAVDGSTLVVCPGTWVGPFTATVPVTLTAFGNAFDTTLSGDHLGPALTVPGGSAVSGFAIRDGEGGGLVLSSAGTLDVDASRIDDNHGVEGGGVVLVSGGVARIDRSDIQGNVADGRGGGVYVPAGASVDLSDTVISENTAGIGGGGAALLGGTMFSGSFEVNRALGEEGGGAVLLTDGAATTGLYAYDNEAVRGGGLAIHGVATVAGATVDDNRATGPDAAGGGVWCDGCDVVFDDTSVYNNQSDGVGGSVAARASSLVWLYGWVESSDAVAGGGVWADGSTIENLSLYGTTATDGGGIYLTGAPSTLVDVSIDAGAADRGGGIAIVDAAVTIRGGSMDGCRAAVAGGGVYLGGTGSVVFDGTDFGVGTANDPDDVNAGGVAYVDQGAGASFGCDAAGCSP